MKKLIVTVVALLALIACKKEETHIQNQNTDLAPHSISGIVGIAKIIAHPALDDIERGIVDELKSQGYNSITIDRQNANGEISTAGSITNKFRNDKALVAVGIATPMALSLAGSLKNTPIVFSGVTDPIDAGLRSKNESEPESNIAGVSDMTPVREQIIMATRLKPVKKLGFIYNAGESNSVVLYDIVAEVCKELGIELVVSTVTNTSEVKQATEIVAPKVDFIYATNDNVVYAALGSMSITALKYNVPVMGCVPGGNEETGVLAAYGVDYYLAGKITGQMVIDILNGKKPGEIPVKYMTTPSELGLYINEELAAKMNISIPDDLLRQAREYADKQ